MSGELARTLPESDATGLELPGDDGSVYQMMRIALSGDAPANVEVLERLVALQERTEDRRARAALFAARSAFQGETDPIFKNRKVDHATRSGARKTYNFASIDEIARTIREPLARHGLAYSWQTVERDCVCTLYHIDGGTHTATHPILVDDDQKGMSPAQRYASAQTYAKRYSLTSVLGLTTTDEDDDNAGEVGEGLTEAEVATLSEWIESTSADPIRFLRYLKVEALSDLDRSKYEWALGALKNKAGAP